MGEGTCVDFVTDTELLYELVQLPSLTCLSVCLQGRDHDVTLPPERLVLMPRRPLRSVAVRC